MNRRLFMNTSLPVGVGGLLGGTSAFAKSNYNTGNNEVPKTINPLDFGAKGDGYTDDTKALQQALDKLEEGSAFVLPAGSYLISQPLIIHQKQNVMISGMGPGSKLIGTSRMKYLLKAEWPFSGSIISSICLDANSNADVALRVVGGTYVKLDHLDIIAPREIGIHGGPEDPESKCGPEIIITNSRLTGMYQPTANDHASKIGILIEKGWTDSHYDNLIIRGFAECAMELRANSNLINKIHVYRYPAFQYFSGMRLKGNENYLVQAYFDNAIDVGCEVLGHNTTILSSYILRINLAFNKGPVAPGVGIRVGSEAKKIKNVNIINTSFVNHVSNTPEFANNKLDGIELVNGENIVAYDNQYDRTEGGDTRLAGKAEISSGQLSETIKIDSLVRPQNIQLTPASKISGNYWVSDVSKESFKVNLSEVQKEKVVFNFITRE